MYFVSFDIYLTSISSYYSRYHYLIIIIINGINDLLDLQMMWTNILLRGKICLNKVLIYQHQ